MACIKVARLLLPVLLAAASAAQLAAAACSAQNVSGEAACPSCNLCYATEAAALTLELAQNAYDSAANITTFSFLVSPADGCAYRAFVMQLRPAFAAAPLPNPEEAGVPAAPQANPGCDSAVGLSRTLTWKLSGTEPDQYGRYKAMVRLAGHWELGQVFEPLAEQSLVSGGGEDVTPLRGVATSTTFMGVLLNAKGTQCVKAPKCAFATFDASARQQSDYALSLTSTAGAGGSSVAAQSLNFNVSPQPDSIDRVYVQAGNPWAWAATGGSGSSPEPDLASCHDAFRVFQPQCETQSRACPSCWSSAKNINPSGSAVTVARLWSPVTGTTTFTFHVRWGNIGCQQFAGSTLPVRSLCRMRKFVVPLAPGAAPLEYGHLAPLLPGASAQAVVVRQSGCDAGTHSGLANTVTWNLMEVDPAVLTTLVSHGGDFASLVFKGRVDYGDVFAQLSDATFEASDPVPLNYTLVATPPGSLAYYTEDDTGACANGYYQYAGVTPSPAPQSSPGSGNAGGLNTSSPSPGGPTGGTTGAGGQGSGSGGEGSGSAGSSGSSTGGGSGDGAGGQGGNGGNGTASGGGSGSVSGRDKTNEGIEVPGVGLVAYSINAQEGTVYIYGIGELSIKGKPGSPGFVTIPGVGDVLIPGYMIPTPAGLSASRLTGGSSPVAALGYLALYHTTCAGPLTLRAEVSGELEPVLTVQPEEVTTQLGEVAKLAVSLAGKITEDSYTGRILLNFTSADPGCSAAIVANMLMASPLTLTQGAAVVAVMEMPLPASSSTAPSGSSSNTIQVAVNLDVMSTTTSGVRTEVLSALLALRQALDPTGDALAWSPSSSYCGFSGVKCDQQGAVVAISLPGLGLAGTLPQSPDVWQQLSSLARLNLADNELTGPIPDSLSLLTSAATIDLSANSFSGTVPPALAALSPAAVLSLRGNQQLCGGVTRGLLDGMSVAVEGTGLGLPCFERWVEVPLPGGPGSIPIGPGLQLTSTAGPNPTLLEGFDADKVSLQLSGAPKAGTLSLRGAALVEGASFSWADLTGGAVAYTPAAAAPPEGSADSFLLRVSYAGGPAPATDMFFALALTKDAGGFPATARVTMQGPNGPEPVAISEVSVGDKVEAVCASGVCYDEVFLLPYQQVGTEGAFLQLTTADGSRLRLGPAQYIPAVASAAEAPAPVLAASIKPGQYIWVVDPANELALVASEVTAVSWVTAPGRILPVTLQGGLVVDAARVSVYYSGLGSPEAMQAAVSRAREAYLAMRASKNSTTQADYMAAAKAATEALGSPEVLT